MKLCIATGGTGGHLYPAQVMYDCCVRRGVEAFLVLNKTALTEKITGPGQAKRYFISAAATGRSGPGAILRFLAVNITGFFQSIKIIRTEKPTHILGFGGYSSFAAVLAGRILFKKVFIFEPNAVFGLANFLAGLFSEKISAFSGPDFFGAPVRREFFRKPDEKFLKSCNILPEVKKTRILIMGGSQGAHSINLAVMEALPHLKPISEIVQFIHMTGPLDREGVECGYRLHKFEACVMDYCERIYDLFLVCDLAVCRAGASTLWELVAARLPSILIPYPKAKLNHQLKNAGKFSEKGLGMIVEEKDLNPVFLARLLSEIVSGKDLLVSMKKFLSRIDIENIPDRILDRMSESRVERSRGGARPRP